MLKTFQNLLQDESGVTMIEYGLIAALVALAAAGAAGALGTDLSNFFTSIGTKLTSTSTGG